MTYLRLPSSVRAARGLAAAGALSALAVLGGCDSGKKSTQAAADAGTTAAAEPKVTLLITADENGALQAQEGKGGAAEMLGQWVGKEKHCAKGAPCDNPGTLALSTGDHWNGPAVSTLFYGESVAQVMNRMNYAASGLGNHEMDFGKETFLKNRQAGGFPYVAANLKATDGSAKDLQLPPFEVLERRGFKIGVVGLARKDIAATTMSGRWAGVEVAPYEQALSETLPKVWAAGVDAVVVLVDDCPTQLEEAVKKNADWKVSVVAGGECREDLNKTESGTVLASPGRRFQSYLRAELTFDKGKPQKERVTKVDADVRKVEGGTPHAETAAVIAGFKQQTDQQLGEQIGFTKAGLPQDSAQLQRWILESWRAALNTDVAIVNKKGLRAGLPAGPITKNSVYEVLPFENSLMGVELTGAQLVEALDNEQALYAGVTKAGKGYKDAKGKAIDPKKNYTVATVEFLYFGGDNFKFEQADPEPTESGMAWQTPVIEWTRKQQSTQAKPLESMLAKK